MIPICKPVLLAYLGAALISGSLFARDSEWCFKASWPRNSFNGNLAIIGVVFPSLLWPIYLSGAIIARDHNEGHYCNFGGKQREKETEAESGAESNEY